jgi:hypothetical protein
MLIPVEFEPIFEMVLARTFGGGVVEGGGGC